jgi:hypothetical protein
MKPKKTMDKKEQIEYWSAQYLQAKANGDTKKIKMYADLIIKLGGKPPRL